jgi:hypothetical protein
MGIGYRVSGIGCRVTTAGDGDGMETTALAVVVVVVVVPTPDTLHPTPFIQSHS